MIRILFLVVTIFAFVMISYKRIEKYRCIRVKNIFSNINKQYADIFKGKKSHLKTWQWAVFVLSQMFIVFAIARGLFEELYKYVSEDYIVAVKIFTYLIMFIFTYIVVGYFMYSNRMIYKYLYRIEDKNTKTDLIISFFIISMYTTILILFPEQFSQIYIVGLMGVSISYVLNLKVLISVIRSPELIEIKRSSDSKGESSNFELVAVILLVMVIISLYLGVCFINNGSKNAYTNNPTYYDLFYYTIITFATIGYGDICPVSTIAKFMSIVISLTSIICLTIFISSMLSYKNEK